MMISYYYYRGKNEILKAVNEQLHSTTKMDVHIYFGRYAECGYLVHVTGESRWLYIMPSILTRRGE